MTREEVERLLWLADEGLIQLTYSDAAVDWGKTDDQFEAWIAELSGILERAGKELFDLVEQRNPSPPVGGSQTPVGI